MSHDDFTQYPQHPSFPDDFITDAYRYVPPPDDLSDVDERFVFDFRSYDDLDDGQRWSTWLSVEPLSRGPEPRPDWVVTSQGAIDTELGILKTGKEADVHLVERADPFDPGERRGHGGQAVPLTRAPDLPPRRVLHRGPRDEALP